MTLPLKKNLFDLSLNFLPSVVVSFEIQHYLKVVCNPNGQYLVFTEILTYSLFPFAMEYNLIATFLSQKLLFSRPATLGSANQTGCWLPKWFPKWNKKSAVLIFHAPFHKPILSYKWQMHKYFRQSLLTKILNFSIKSTSIQCNL